MKSILLITVFLCFIKFGTAQTHSIIGAWLSRDSTEQISIFIKPKGVIQIYSGKNGGVILEKDLKSGKYIYEKGVVVITWPDNTTERVKIDFIDKDSFIIDDFDKKNGKTKQNLIFRKVVDEEG